MRRKPIAVALASLGFGLVLAHPSAAQNRAPTEAEVQFCLGAIPAYASRARAEFDAMAREAQPLLRPSQVERGSRPAANPPLSEEYTALLARMRSYLAARGNPSAGRSATLMASGRRQVDACFAAGDRFFNSACWSSCLDRAAEGAFETLYGTLNACTATCPGKREQERACGRIDQCLTLGDRLPL